MNIKNIKRKLLEKHNEFIASIKDEEIAKIANENMFITGGAIVSLLNNEEPNDYDYYFTNKEALIKVSNYLIEDMNKKLDKKGKSTVLIQDVDNLSPGNRPQNEYSDHEFEKGRVRAYIQSNGIARVKYKEGYNAFLVSSNAITLSDGVQVVIRFYGSPEEIHDNYDFVHCTNYYIPHLNKLVLPQQALQSIITKEMKYIGSKYPLASIIRTRKFIQRGFNINAGQYLKMCMQLNGLNLNNPYVLEEQLTGVDMFYFSQIIAMINSAKDNNIEIDNEYVCKVIDKVFSDESDENEEEE